MLLRFINIISISLLVTFSSLQAQTVHGIIRDFDDDHLVDQVKVMIEGTGISTLTDDNGAFGLDCNGNKEGTLVFSKEGYTLLKKNYSSSEETINIGTVIFTSSSSAEYSDRNAEIEDIDADDDSSDNTYSLLSSGKGLFSQAAAYQLGAARFKRRGYDNKYTNLSLNGATMNNLNDGNAYWGVWGGLNDVFREKNEGANVTSNEIGFGRLGGYTDVDLRASSQRKQIKGSYAISNRSYANRLMLTYSTGMMSNGWAVTASGSKRWANEGSSYTDGVFYDGYSYFLSVDKQLSKSHLLNFVILGAPTTRGKRGASTQEAYDLADSNFYNSNWGYQNGKKRNAKVSVGNQPIAVLRHDWKVSDKTNLSTSVAIQSGTYGTSRLEWNDAPDPRPDYYKNLPSYQLSEESNLSVYNYLKDNPEKLQLDWDKFYEANYYANPTTIDNVGGGDESITGKNAVYALAETHYDNQKLSIQTHLNTQLSDISSLSIGAYYRTETVNNYQKLIDLLGADYYLDIDKFALRDNGGDVDFYQSDLNHPNTPAKVGDKIRYNYDLITSRPGTWAQYEMKLNKFDFFIAGDVSQTSFFRRGNMRNGKFPEISYGDSEIQSIFGYGAKSGVTYKLSGRNYFTLNAGYSSEPIGGRYAYSSARTRNSLIQKLDNEIAKSIDISYIARYTGFKMKATAYFTRFENQNYNRSLYLDNSSNSSFVNYIMTGINKEHKGIELAFEKSIGAGFSIKGVAALGDYRYKSRPNINITYDSSPFRDTINTVGYLKNYFVANTPQVAYTATLSYSSSKYWWANISFNYFDKMYLDIYPDRRTSQLVKGVNKIEESELWHSIIDQERIPANYTMDMYVGKSWKISDYMLYLNVGVNNILNNTSFKTGGYEQTRFDVRDKNVNKFPPKYFYAYGANYYISVAVKI